MDFMRSFIIVSLNRHRKGMVLSDAASDNTLYSAILESIINKRHATVYGRKNGRNTHV